MRGRDFISSLLLLPLLMPACRPAGLVGQMQRGQLRAELSLPGENRLQRHLPDEEALAEQNSLIPAPDTLKVTSSQGEEIIIMKAVRDENGEMVATDVIEAATVTARFRHLAERHGKVDLEFQVTVPAKMQESRWQLRFYPRMLVLADTVGLEPVIITGEAYRKAQLRGYQHYQRFLDSIIHDQELLMYRGQLEMFIKRNIPALYAFRTDSTLVSEEQFLSSFGVSEREAVEHYTKGWKVRINEYRKSRIGAKYDRYVKAPIVTEGIRLDTVIRTDGGDFVYRYVQPVMVRRAMRKVDVFLDGEIFEQDRKIYDIPEAEPLTFYISSLAQFMDRTTRYVDEVIERRVDASTACYVEFPSGSSGVVDTLGHNMEELGRIRSNLLSLVENTVFDLDSIVIVASASPEGTWKHNASLSARRSDAVVDYCRQYISHCRDSVAAEAGFFVGEDGRTGRIVWPEIVFSAGCIPENWESLTSLVAADQVLSARDKESYIRSLEIEDPDKREETLRAEPFYRYMRENLYPRTRTVHFNFFLHRKGMVKDTVHTTRIDTAYMHALDCLEDRDYESALTILRPYADFNTAVALCALDYNSTAQQILLSLTPTPRVKYMLSLIHSRKGDDRQAVQYYLEACAEDPALVHRGNLDPEISSLIKNYHLTSIIDREAE